MREKRGEGGTRVGWSTDVQLLALLDGYTSRLESALRIPSLRLASAELTAYLAHQLQAWPVTRSPFVLCDDPLAAFFRMSIEAETDAATGGGGGGGGGGGCGGGGGGGGGAGGADGASAGAAAAGDEGAGEGSASRLLPLWDDSGVTGATRGASGSAARLTTSSMLSDGGELLCSIWRLPDAKHALAELGGVTAVS